MDGCEPERGQQEDSVVCDRQLKNIWPDKLFLAMMPNYWAVAHGCDVRDQQEVLETVPSFHSTGLTINITFTRKIVSVIKTKEKKRKAVHVTLFNSCE